MKKLVVATILGLFALTGAAFAVEACCDGGPCCEAVMDCCD